LNYKKPILKQTLKVVDYLFLSFKNIRSTKERWLPNGSICFLIQ